MKVNIGTYPEDETQEREIKIQIDPWDTWSMDHTLALIIVPMLKQLKNESHSAGYVDDEDVPSNIRAANAKPRDDVWDLDEFHFDRWHWLMDELIWTFESILDKWKFFDNEEDPETVQEHFNRQNNGLRLFGKYYLTLWD